MVAREARTVSTMLLVALGIGGCLPLAIMLAPDQQVTLAGQQLWVGARDPGPSWSGPAQLVQIGNTSFDMTLLRIDGPLRPRLTLGRVQRNDDVRDALTPQGSVQVQASAAGIIGDGFVRWYAAATALLVLLLVAATAVVGCIRMLVCVSRHTHRRVVTFKAWETATRSTLRPWVSCASPPMWLSRLPGSPPLRRGNGRREPVSRLRKRAGAAVWLSGLCVVFLVTWQVGDPPEEDSRADAGEEEEQRYADG